jgi:hypothetical protein
MPNDSNRVSRQGLKRSCSGKARLQGGTSKDLSGSLRGRRNMAGSATRCGEHARSPIALVCAIMATTLTIDVDQRMHVEALPTETSSSSGVTDMSERSNSELLARREALSLLGWAAALGIATSGTFLFGSEARAQTVGMERRQERRGARHERRQERRMGRTERREERREGRTERREERRN